MYYLSYPNPENTAPLTLKKAFNKEGLIQFVKELAQDSLITSEYLTPSQASKLAGVAPHTVYRWVWDGHFPFRKVEGRYQISKKEFLEWNSKRKRNKS